MANDRERPKLNEKFLESSTMIACYVQILFTKRASVCVCVLELATVALVNGRKYFNSAGIIGFVFVLRRCLLLQINRNKHPVFFSFFSMANHQMHVHVNYNSLHFINSTTRNHFFTAISIDIEIAFVKFALQKSIYFSIIEINVQ